MTEGSTVGSAIDRMPRGGPSATWLDRRLQTNVLEYLDRDDAPEAIKQQVITSLERMGDRTGLHEQNARMALSVVADVTHPRILELGAGHGRLSADIVRLHPTATVTVSDVNPSSVAKISTGELGSHPRVSAQLIDATAIDAADSSYDLVVFALAFHHLPPAAAYRAIAEATRVGRHFLVIDLARPPAPALLAATLSMGPLTRLTPTLHDGLISFLRAYSRSALLTLGRTVDPDMRVEFLPRPNARRATRTTNVVFSRSTAQSTAPIQPT